MQLFQQPLGKDPLRLLRLLPLLRLLRLLRLGFPEFLATLEAPVRRWNQSIPARLARLAHQVSQPDLQDLSRRLHQRDLCHPLIRLDRLDPLLLEVLFAPADRLDPVRRWNQSIPAHLARQESRRDPQGQLRRLRRLNQRDLYHPLIQLDRLDRLVLEGPLLLEGRLGLVLPEVPGVPGVL